ncbi:MAG: SprT family zinc-dependent metalloprotease [Pseudomonadota bacterium]
MPTGTLKSIKPVKLTKPKPLVVITEDNERFLFTRVLKRTTKRPTRMTLRIQRDGSIVVSAPKRLADKTVQEWVLINIPWIKKRLTVLSTLKEKNISFTYLSGEKHLYLGKRYTLEIIKTANLNSPSFKLIHGKIQVHTPDVSANYIKEHLYAWYTLRAYEIFTEQLSLLLPKVPWVKEMPPLRIAQMKTRWGSCSMDNRICMNLYLVKAPKTIINFILFHELCHIAEHNHSVRFYRLMDQVLPEWREIKAELKTLQPLLMSH